MNLNDYQNAARKTLVSPNEEHMAFGLLEEAGEIAGIFKRYYREDREYCDVYQDVSEYRTSMTAFALERVKAELGDVLWYVAMLADVCGYTLDKIAKENLAKLQRRKAKDMIHGSGDDR